MYDNAPFYKKKIVEWLQQNCPKIKLQWLIRVFLSTEDC